LKCRGRRGGGVIDKKGGVIRKSKGEFRTLDWINGLRKRKGYWSVVVGFWVGDGIDGKGTSVEKERTRVRVLESEEC
jgi:hypothetical protein